MPRGVGREGALRDRAGTGRGHRWRARNIGGQDSEWTAATLTTNYAPPVITGLVGPGARDAPARGGARLTISGVNFGEGKGTLSAVWNTDEYDAQRLHATDCEVTVPHSEIVCLTPMGAVGTAIDWNVVVDAQISTRPSATAAPPVIERVIASDADMSTNGSTSVTIHGVSTATATTVSTR